MTIINGSRTFAAPCCGNLYRFPNYISMNFSAFEYWTDGWNDGVLMPRDYGIRVCACGCFVLRADLLEVSAPDTDEGGHMAYLAPERIGACIAAASSAKMEINARRYQWHEWNHAYRGHYRAHRKLEEAALQSAWESDNPDTRNFWQRLLRHKPPVYTRPDAPITHPPFEANADQLANMMRLGELLTATGREAAKHEMLEVAELYREAGRFDEAAHALAAVPYDENPVARGLIGGMIKKNDASPLRFRY